MECGAVCVDNAVLVLTYVLNFALVGVIVDDQCIDLVLLAEVEDWIDCADVLIRCYEFRVPGAYPAISEAWRLEY